MNITRSALAALAATTLVLGAGGCASSTEYADAARRRDMVMVPPDAQPVDGVAWSSVRNVEPLNRRMVLFRAERPYLLVLARPCNGLRPDSIVIQRGSLFRPRVDTLEVQDPTNPLAMNGPLSGQMAWVNTLQQSPHMLESVQCRPDTLYALRDEDVDAVRAAVTREED